MNASNEYVVAQANNLFSKTSDGFRYKVKTIIMGGRRASVTGGIKGKMSDKFNNGEEDNIL